MNDILHRFRALKKYHDSLLADGMSAKERLEEYLKEVNAKYDLAFEAVTTECHNMITMMREIVTLDDERHKLALKAYNIKIEISDLDNSSKEKK